MSWLIACVANASPQEDESVMVREEEVGKERGALSWMVANMAAVRPFALRRPPRRRRDDLLMVSVDGFARVVIERRYWPTSSPTRAQTQVEAGRLQQ